MLMKDVLIAEAGNHRVTQIIGLRIDLDISKIRSGRGFVSLSILRLSPSMAKGGKKGFSRDRKKYFPKALKLR